MVVQHLHTVSSESSTLSITTKVIANVAQSVEQRIENPCVTGSIPVFGTSIKSFWLF